jgi:hypothetical protein
LLAAAKQTGWRYLLVQNDEVVAEAELAGARSGAKGAKGTTHKGLEFAGLTHGPFTGATVDGLHAAERLPQIAKADYELRLLKVPAVYLVALWLHGGAGDILIPMGNPPGGLKKNGPTPKRVSSAHCVLPLYAQISRCVQNQRKRRPEALMVAVRPAPAAPLRLARPAQSMDALDAELRAAYRCRFLEMVRAQWAYLSGAHDRRC